MEDREQAALEADVEALSEAAILADGRRLLQEDGVHEAAQEATSAWEESLKKLITIIMVQTPSNDAPSNDALQRVLGTSAYMLMKNSAVLNKPFLPNHANGDGTTPLIYALKKCKDFGIASEDEDAHDDLISDAYDKMVRTLLHFNADPNGEVLRRSYFRQRLKYTTVPLLAAVKLRNINLVQLLLSNGANAHSLCGYIDFKFESEGNYYLETPLLIAIYLDDPTIVGALLPLPSGLDLTREDLPDGYKNYIDMLLQKAAPASNLISDATLQILETRLTQAGGGGGGGRAAAGGGTAEYISHRGYLKY